jgi:hypothetical protein
VLITLTNQTVPVTGLTVTTQGNVPATITTNGGSLQMVATITPANASNQNVTWSIVPVSGTASIGTNGLVTAITNGTVYAKAVSVANPSAKDSVLITITNQIVAVTGLTVTTQGNIPATITTNAGTLQMVATIAPANAINQNVTWSIVPGTGTASISTAGLVTAITNGTVHAKAVSDAINTLKDSVLITISNQVVTAVVNPTLRSLTIYPNPAHDQITLKLLKNHPAMQLQIVNAAGQVVLEESLAANQLRNLHSIRVDWLSGGLYYVKFLEGRTESIFRFLMQ